MEVPYQLLLVTFSFIFLFLKLSTKLRSKGSAPLPPGPPRLPIIGNIHQMVGALPHRALRNLSKKYGPIMHLKMGQISTVVFTSPDAAKEVMKTHDINFASRPRLAALDVVSYGATNIGFSPYGDYWRQLRRVCTTELFSVRRVQSYRHHREEETSTLMKWIAENEGLPVNLTEKIHNFTFSSTSKAAFGKTNPYQERFVALAKESIQIAEAFNVADLFPSVKFLHAITGVKARIERVHHQMDEIFTKLIDEHRTGGPKDGKVEDSKDLVDVLLKYHEDESLGFTPSINNIKAVILEIFTAGTETSATTADWAMTELMKNPATMKMAQQEVREVFAGRGHVDEAEFEKLKYMKAIIKETLRLHPPLPLLLPRQNIEECEVNGYRIPARTNIMINAWAINRDPAYWKDADTFQPERFLDSPLDYKGFNYEYTPFGGGRRVCPGMHLGMANLELPLAKFLFHFDWKLPGEMTPEDVDLTEAPGFTVRRLADLFAVPTVRIPPT